MIGDTGDVFIHTQLVIFSFLLLSLPNLTQQKHRLNCMVKQVFRFNKMITLFYFFNIRTQELISIFSKFFYKKETQNKCKHQKSLEIPYRH